MRRLLAVLFVALAAPWLMAAAKPATPTVDYRLSPVMREGKLTALAVEIRFRADPSGQTRLHLPDSYASEKTLWRYVRDLHVDGAQSVTEDGPAHRIIRSAPRATLTVRYQVVSAVNHEPTEHDGEAFAAWVRPTWFYASGEAVFAVPELPGDPAARFDWTGAPKGFVFASDVEHLAGLHRRATRPGTVNDITESALLGGFDVKLLEIEDHGARLRVAMRGAYGFTGPQLLDLVHKVMDAERGFWSDGGSPFLVTVAPLISGPGSKSLAGSGRSDAFMMSISPTATVEDLRWILAHENFHTWNPRQLGGLKDGPDEALGYWFSEGFTDFYAERLLWRSGLFDAAAFAKSWNDDLLAYASSSVRREPNERIKADFWSNREVEKLPYQRGALLAAIWDARLRKTSGGRVSLDDVMHYQRGLATAAKGPTTAADLFVPAAAHFGLDVKDDIARYVVRGEPIVLDADVFGPCFRVETVTSKVFDRGYDTDATSRADNIVTGLRPDSPAYAAGLRDGMKLLGRAAGEPGNPDLEYGLKVKDGANERVIRFMPVGKGTLTSQRLVKADLAACTTPQ
ncbi:MAG TPA: M61 family peptidase [Caulobacteraceae bacterium]|jgi:predicted metalloprotease with PDZ domain